ncbi:MAG: UDP-N-acetylmuramate:L-alanyl-gamma-D-glutamyl-meso-diaminopimelate ligase [Deltaproteobacteria bacterium]|nr:UDP-N-acetylmuramate:L-alanyl-gamma-D-glutamyl-meso-diaminopimelate ligase [Deltaproteobacteria bacterium]MBW2116343.1 UDP-N-acetylmuramate:L-alanyl-gamma-D-glutamyl-meso-diaminopimelate ligase [Deltaproteobacteria bacterium]MBW2342438.1 UDP-N-acetylmuramate:L-alanyl-gamma-D-glutamyl-meso-diaminopimelate ligase [Deltaproteobacteria bacterium]
MGICGTGMASLAGILKEKGYRVTGSDQNVYLPMSDFLEALSIPVMEGYSPDNLYPGPDLVIVGNVITRNNPEARELSRLALPYLSFPQALKRFAFKDKSTIVISGTHGKTTTSALVSWVLEKAGMDPGFMIGGIPLDFKKNFKLGNGPYFVIEGDEYDTAFFDKGPKFLHYGPWVTILTSIEFDHADIYRDLDHVIESFRKLIDLMPPEGLLIANGDDPIITAEINRAKCPVSTYGLSGNSLWKAIDITVQEDFTCFKVLKAGKDYITLCTPLYGRHNISNLLSTIVLADFIGISFPILSKTVKSFGGIRRRQEVIGEKSGILVLDDFAHHPTAVKETIRAVKEKYKGRRLIAVFEPRSNSSRRNIFQEQYAASFDSADLIMVPEPPMTEKIPMGERFSSKRLEEDLEKRDLAAFSFPNTDPLIEALVKETRPGDVVLIMSNGGFDNIHHRLLERL